MNMIGEMQTRLRRACKRSLASSCARRFIRQQDGAAAIEFGMVAAPFLAMVFAIMETALVFFAGQALETAGADSARLIMTGQAQTQGFDQAKFKQAVCGKIYGLFNCAGGLYVDVKNYSSFAAVNTGKPIDSSGNCRPEVSAMRPGPLRHRGRAPDVSVAGLCVSARSQPVRLGGSKRLLMSTVAFRNEPYLGTCP